MSYYNIEKDVDRADAPDHKQDSPLEGNPNTFDDNTDYVIARIQELLKSKGDEYATVSNRLHNFTVAAELQNVTRPQALAGMMAKHTVSVYDLCAEFAPPTAPLSPEKIIKTLTKWDEKILDHITYLVLLRAIVLEEIYES